MKLINKDALVAEIERLREEKGTFYASDVLYNLEDFINTLEVKEVNEEPASKDFEEEYDNYTKHILACDVQFKPFTHLYNCAKYFFELGLKAKGE